MTTLFPVTLILHKHNVVVSRPENCEENGPCEEKGSCEMEGPCEEKGPFEEKGPYFEPGFSYTEPEIKFATCSVLSATR